MARLRRSLPKNRRTLPGAVAGESATVAPELIQVHLPDFETEIINIPVSSEIEIVNNNSLHDQLSQPAIPNKIRASASVKKNVRKSHIIFYVCNIRCLLSNLAELCVHLQTHRPHVVMLQETWLDASVENVAIPGYKIISRRDRHETANRGGILTLAREDFNGLSFISNCAEEERS